MYVILHKDSRLVGIKPSFALSYSFLGISRILAPAFYHPFGKLVILVEWDRGQSSEVAM
jgi:hypothetical protein